jgi:hypothetical protein
VKTVRLEVQAIKRRSVLRRGLSLKILLQTSNREKLMKTWQILLVIWMTGVGFWIANQFNRQNIERLKKRSSGA